IGDSIDVGGIGAAASYTYSGGMLALQDNTGRQLIQVALSSVLANPVFALGPDGSSGTLVTEIAPYSIETPLMTNTSGVFDYDVVINGQMVYTRIGTLGPEWEF